jgi:phosphate-selective porin OprO/OprP
MRYPAFTLRATLVAVLLVLSPFPCLPEAAPAEQGAGFYLKSGEDDGMELRLGGGLQLDYRYYAQEERADNRFDIRRARIDLCGRLTEWLRFGLQYEFQGSETSNLVDAYGEAAFSGLQALKFGQFKEPFSLELQTSYKDIYFAEYSMGYHLTPKRDVGLMLHGSLYEDGLNYAVGLFNGDGTDGSSRGSEHDEPEIAGRLVFKPFGATPITWLRSLQIGGSATYAKIDLANVDLKVESTGMAGTGRSLYVLGHDTKFGVLQDVDERIRGALEMGWASGPFAVQAEYMRLKYTGLTPVTEPPGDAEFSSWYASIAYFLTGEEQVSTGGIMKPVSPRRSFNPSEGTFGALCLAARIEHFSGDEAWIKEKAYVSVREADAFSIAATWTLYPTARIIVDYTYTDFSDPLRVRVNPDGSIDYIEKENVLTLRFGIYF